MGRFLFTSIAISLPALLAVSCNHATTQPATQPTAKIPAQPTTKLTSVVFIIDATGSMLGEQFDFVKEQVGMAIGRLNPTQSFDVVFFKEQRFDALSQRLNSSSLLPAIQENKRQAILFLKDVETGPDSDPIPALRYAFSLNPQRIYVLTDGFFDNSKETIEECRQLNANHKIIVSTIAICRFDIEPDDKKIIRETLMTIARENGGSYTERSTVDIRFTKPEKP